MTLARLRLLAELLDEFADWNPHPSRLARIDGVLALVYGDIAAILADLAVEGSGVSA